MKRLSLSSIPKQIVWLPAIIAFLSTLYYIFLTYRVYFHSDSADLQLWAEQVMKAHWPLSHDFSYAEPRQIFNYHLLAIPWLLFFPPSMLGHSLASGIFCGLFFATFVWATRRMGFSPLAASVSAALVFATPSPLVADMFWGQQAYGWESLFTILLAGFAFQPNHLKIEPSLAARSGKLFYALLFTTCALFCLNGSRPVLIYFAPVFATLLLFPAFEGADFSVSQYYKSISKTAVFMLAGCLTGIIGMKFFTRGFTFQFSGITTTYDPTQLKAVISLLPIQYLNALNAVPPTGTNVNSLAGIGQFINAVFALLLLGSACYLTFNYKNLNSRAVRYLLLCFWITSIGIMYPFVFSLANHIDWLAMSRYLIPLVILLLVIFGCFIDHLLRRGKLLLVVISLSLAFVSIGQSISFLLSYRTAHYRQNQHERLIGFLLDRDLHYGYATYWNASVVTVRSGSKVKIRPVLLGSTMSEFPFCSANSWYDPEYTLGKSFLVLSRDEEKSILADAGTETPLASLLKSSKERLVFENFSIYVYDYNLARNIYPQGALFAKAMWMAAELPGIIGHINGTNRMAQQGIDAPGTLTYGPYITIKKPGKYWVRIFYTANFDDEQSAGHWDIGTFGDRKLELFKGGFRKGFNLCDEQIITVPAHGLSDLQVRSFYFGFGILEIQKIEIERTSNTVQK